MAFAELVSQLGKLLLVSMWLRPARLHALPQHRVARSSRELPVPGHLAWLVQSHGLDDTTVHLAEGIGDGKDLVVLRQPARHRLAIVPHVARVAIGGEP